MGFKQKIIRKQYYNRDYLQHLQHKLLELRNSGGSFEEAKRILADNPPPEPSPRRMKGKFQQHNIPVQIYFSEQMTDDMFLAADGSIDHNAGRVIIGPTQGNNNDTLTFYLEHIPLGVKSAITRSILYPRTCGLFGRNKKNSLEILFFDEWDLLGQRKQFIPIRRIKLGDSTFWIQTDKDITTVYALRYHAEDLISRGYKYPM
jgi:hypothetical protein